MDKLPGMGDMAGMLKQLRQMQGELAKAQKELARETVTAEAGRGAVQVTVTGDQRVTDLQIDPELLASGDAGQLSQLLQEAFNKALDESREMAKKRLGPLASGLGG
ncbi:MAG: YbaB/EbfC family nucleoid-associated protein [Anaerolineales bacterium]|nr:YbaB/EbfC family nucleoid-associated protein [Anaerolineales bacterium]